jgi:hypothetical protein
VSVCLCDQFMCAIHHEVITACRVSVCGYVYLDICISYGIRPCEAPSPQGTPRHEIDYTRLIVECVCNPRYNV